jgi:TPR repeat protein
MNWNETVKYFKLAAVQHHADCQLMYGVCLHEGDGVSVSHIEAAKYYELAGNENVPIA